MTKVTVRLKPHCSHRLPEPDGGLGIKHGPGSILKVTEQEARSFADKFEPLLEEMIRPEAVQAEYEEPDATPAAIKLAKQHNVALGEVDEGTGKNGKVVQEDVQKVIDGRS